MNQSPWVRLAVITISVSGSSPTVITTPSDVENYSVIFMPSNELIYPGQSTPAAAPVVSTGPVIMKSSVSADCYRIQKVNPNGTISPYPLPWVNCPQ